MWYLETIDLPLQLHLELSLTSFIRASQSQDDLFQAIETLLATNPFFLAQCYPTEFSNDGDHVFSASQYGSQ
jgi:hypothetical protein